MGIEGRKRGSGCLLLVLYFEIPEIPRKDDNERGTPLAKDDHDVVIKLLIPTKSRIVPTSTTQSIIAPGYVRNDLPHESTDETKEGRIANHSHSRRQLEARYGDEAIFWKLRRWQTKEGLSKERLPL